MAPISDAFVRAIQDFAKAHEITVIRLLKGKRKDTIAAEYLARFQEEEGIFFIGKAQENF